MRHLKLIAASAIAAFPFAAIAQDADSKAPLRTRVILGPQLTPSAPGADKMSFGPFIEVGRTRGDRPFEFEAADESFGFPVVDVGSVEFGPALSLLGKRGPSEIGANLPTVARTPEIGIFAQGHLTPAVRLRAELRRGIGGHDGWVSELSADAIARDGDNWLGSLGPRMTLTDRRYQRAYSGVTSAASAASGLAAYRPNGGISAVGISASGLVQLDKRWGLATYARYDRLVGDAGRSPIARGPGSRNQPSVGLALSYIFGQQ